MKGFVLILGISIAFLIGLVAGPNTALADAEDRLINNTYRCTVEDDLGGEFEDCFTFSPGPPGGDFELESENLGETVACDTKAKGKPGKAKFDKTNDFICVTQGTSLNGIAWVGKVTSNGKKIKKGAAYNADGITFVFRCVQEPGCSLVTASEGAESDYLKKK